MSASATQGGHNNNLTCNARTVEKISSRRFGQSPGGQSETFLSVLQLTSLHLIYRRVLWTEIALHMRLLLLERTGLQWCIMTFLWKRLTMLLRTWLRDFYDVMPLVHAFEGCFYLLPTVFSERELTFTFAICYRPSVCRLSSVCRM